MDQGEVDVHLRQKHSDGSGSSYRPKRDIDAAVRQVIGGAVDADEVIDLFAVAGLVEGRLDILTDEFLGRVAALDVATGQVVQAESASATSRVSWRASGSGRCPSRWRRWRSDSPSTNGIT